MLRVSTRFKLACKELYREVLPFTASEKLPSFGFRRPELPGGQTVGPPTVLVARGRHAEVLATAGQEARLAGQEISPLSGFRLAHPRFDGGELPLNLERVTHPLERFFGGCSTLPFKQEESAQDERRRRQSEGNENRSAMGNLHICGLGACSERGCSPIGRFTTTVGIHQTNRLQGTTTLPPGTTMPPAPRS